MLETWEAALRFCAAPEFSPIGENPEGNPQALDVAKFLGWTTEQKQNESTYTVMDHLAQICNHAYHLIQEGRLGYANLEGLSVRAVGGTCFTMVKQPQENAY